LNAREESHAAGVPNWHGAPDELERLLLAIEHHCGCHTGALPPGTPCCAAHAMLGDVRVLDHLLYGLRTRQHFWRSEWTTELGAHPSALPDSFWAS